MRSSELHFMGLVLKFCDSAFEIVKTQNLKYLRLNIFDRANLNKNLSPYGI